MKSILFLIPQMNGLNERCNNQWTDELCAALKQGRWNVITPAALLLASIAAEMDYEPVVTDEEFRAVDLNRSYDIVCMYTVTPNARRAYAYAEQFRKRGSWVAFGGVHSYFMKEEAREHCDTLLIGEGEYIFRRFLSDFRKGRPKKIYQERLSGVNMEDSPVPLYSCLNEEEQKLIPVQTARGCPHNCRFCNVNSLYGGGFRAKNKGQIREELYEIKKLKGCKAIYITNDNIFSTGRHFEELLEVMEESVVPWYANADISFGQSQTPLSRAYESGLRQVLIGLESTESENLYKLDKNNFKYRHLNKYRDYIKRIQSSGIGVIGSFIVGQPHDTEDSFLRLEEFIYETNLYGANVTIMTPYPGTEIFASMSKEKRILSYNWDEYTIFRPVIRLDNMSYDQLMELYSDLILSIHSKEFVSRRMRYFTDIYQNL